MSPNCQKALDLGESQLAELREVESNDVVTIELYYWMRAAAIRIDLARSRAIGQLLGLGTETHRQWLLAKYRIQAEAISLDKQSESVMIDSMVEPSQSVEQNNPARGTEIVRVSAQGHFFAELGQPVTLGRPRRKAKKTNKNHA